MNTLGNHSHNIKRIALVTDAWRPQINGVVTTLSTLVAELSKQNIEVRVFHPNDYPNFPLPSYPEIRCVWNPKGLKKTLLGFKPDALHIATEGTLGWYVRHLALRHNLPFTSGYHTRYPEYIKARWPVPLNWSYGFFRYFHKHAKTTLVPANSIKQTLQQRGFTHLKLMSRGVDTTLYHPSRKRHLPFERPIQLFVGRVAPEKNLKAFLSIDNPGSKVVVGQGPDQARLQTLYPKAIFVGAKHGIELAEYYASADVFVFPSITDTFGVVNIEAIASGTPVAAYPVTGPIDIISQGVNGITHPELEDAIQQALTLDREHIHNTIPEFTWQHASQQFLNILHPIDWSSPNHS